MKSRKDDALKVRYLAEAKAGSSTALTPEEQNRVVAQTTSVFANGSSPTFYARHMNFLNFADVGSELKPVYINLVRYPVDRFISHFNFRRYGDNRLQGRRVSSTTHNLNYVSIQFLVIAKYKIHEIYFNDLLDVARMCNG